jgi:hypothetical protein
MADEKKMDEVSEDELDQIIQDMASEEEPVEPFAPQPIPLQKGTSPKVKAKKAAEQSLTMELTGVVNLKLCFASGERSIEVICTEESLLCKLADGTEFRIPTGVAKKSVAA